MKRLLEQPPSKPKSKRVRTNPKTARDVPWVDLDAKKDLARRIPLGNNFTITEQPLEDSWVMVRSYNSAGSTLPTVRMHPPDVIKANLAKPVLIDSAKKTKSTKPKTDVKKKAPVAKRTVAKKRTRVFHAIPTIEKANVRVRKKPELKPKPDQVTNDQTFVTCGFKIRLRPTVAQKRKFQYLFKVFDKVYNNCVFLHTQRNVNPKTTMVLENLCYPNPALLTEKSRNELSRFNPEYRPEKYNRMFEGVHSDIRKEAVAEFWNRLQSTRKSLEVLSQKQQRRKTRFLMKPRDLNSTRRILKVPQNGGRPGVKIAKDGVIFWPQSMPTQGGTKRNTAIPFWKHGKRLERELTRLRRFDANFDETKESSAEGVLYSTKKTCTILYDSGRYFLIVPIERREPKLKVKAGEMARVASCDSGARIFQTVFDTCGNYKEYGYSLKKEKTKTPKSPDNQKVAKKKGGADVLVAKILKCDKNQALSTFKCADKAKQTRVRRTARRKWRNLLHRIEDQQHDAHIRIAKSMCNDADHILFPPLNTKNMSARVSENGSKRKLRRVTVRAMHVWAHGKFRQVLEHVGKMTGTGIHIVSEPYTTKGCMGCFKVHETIGSSEHFTCPHGCGYSHPRDQHSSRSDCILNLSSIGEYVGSLNP
jgi:transposase